MSDIAISQGPGGRVEIRVDRDTIWLSMTQIADLFGVNVPAISKHVKNIYATDELDAGATVSKMETVRQEGKRRVTRSVEFYSLDMIISVGYRVNSAQATQFRIWATQTLKEHLTRGYTLNRQRLEQNTRELETALRLVRQAAAGEALTTDQGRGLVDQGALLAEGFRRAVLKFLAKNGALSEELRSRMLAWRHAGFSAHNEVSVAAEDAEGRKKLAGYMLRAPMSLEKMTYCAQGVFTGMFVFVTDRG